MNIGGDIINNYEKFALIKAGIEFKVDDSEYSKYLIREIETRGIVILENFEEAKMIINEWLKKGIEVFKSEEEFDMKYPPISADQRLAESRIFWWESIPKEEWPKELRDYFENNQYWKEFRLKNNLSNPK